MKIAIILTLHFLFGSITGCATLRKEINFVDAKYPMQKGTGYYGPRSQFSAGPIEISSTESISIGAYVENSAEGTYLLGIIVPIVPVFWWPESHFSLKKENIQIGCGVLYTPKGKKHHEKNDEGDFYLSQAGVDAIDRRRRIGSDRCAGVVLVLPNGKTLSSQKTEFREDRGSTLFTFDILATDVKEFKFKIPSIQLATGEAVKTDFEYEARLLDWTRYVIFSPL